VASVTDLPAVRVLVSSFTEHHPHARFHVLLVDTDDIDPESGFRHPASIGVSETELARLRTACTPAQLCAVLRPRLIRSLLGSTDTSGPVLYLDPAVLVLDSVVEPVLTGLVEHSMVLLPRVLHALPDDGLRPDAAELRTAGLFDPALIAVNRGAEAFLRSWAEHALADPAAAATFLEGAAVLLGHHVLRDPGFGLSVWNAGQRILSADEQGALTVDGAPLRTVHFAGFDPARPWLLAAAVADRPRVLLSEHPVLARLCARYVAALAAASAPGDPQPVDQRVGSARLPATLRARYRTAWLAAERTGQQPPPALDAVQMDFLDWACAPADHQPGSSRWSAALWESDEELRHRFPDPSGADAAGFREWCTGPGVSAGLLPPEAVPQSTVGQARLTDQLGVSVLGTGPVAELVRAAATASGLPVSDRAEYPVLVCCAGATAPAEFTATRYLVAVPGRPADLARHGEVDECWTLSHAGKAELAEYTSVSTHPIVLPVPDTGERDQATQDAARQRLGWPEKPDGLVFAALAEHAHERADNALGTVSAFIKAFPDRADVSLLLLTTGAADQPEAAERLRLAVAMDDRIRLVENASAEDHTDWVNTADCLVALHRAEQEGADRIGLALVGPVARGIPVLAGDLGVAGELFARDAALLVPRGVSGSAPDTVAAVEMLRTAAEDPDALAEIGRLGRAALLRSHAVSVAGDQVRQRVEHAYHLWRARRSVERGGQAMDPLRPLRSARHVLLREPDVGVGYKIPMAPALRKAVLRVLNHYDHHLRTMLGTLVDGMERSVEEVVRRQEALGANSGYADPDALSEEVDSLIERATHVDAQLSGVDDSVVRARADLATQSRRVSELEDVLVSEATKRGKQVEALAERLDRLTAALDRTLDRIDAVEAQVGRTLREQDVRTDASLRAAGQALRTSDALRRVVLREHERRAQDHPLVPVPEQPPSSVVLCDAGLLRLPADDGVMLPLLSSNGVWEPELSTLIDSLVEPGGVFLDIGAYVGYHTVRVLSRLGTSGLVVAVEPEPGAVELLRYNVSVNVPERVADRLIVVPAAAWDTPGELATEPAMTGGVLVRPDATAGEPSTDPASPPALTVPAVRLDKEFEGMPALQGARLSVVKVDTPGRGHRALGGLVRLMRRDRPHVFCAFSASRTSEIGDDPITVLREFDTWGYDVLVVGDEVPSTPQQVLEATKNQHSTTLWLRPRGRMPGQ
jgi:FkbM family methyltransferase